jgi:hypothetical protein
MVHTRRMVAFASSADVNKSLNCRHRTPGVSGCHERLLTPSSYHVVNLPLRRGFAAAKQLVSRAKDRPHCAPDNGREGPAQRARSPRAWCPGRSDAAGSSKHMQATGTSNVVTAMQPCAAPPACSFRPPFDMTFSCFVRPLVRVGAGRAGPLASATAAALAGACAVVAPAPDMLSALRLAVSG